MTLGYLDRAPPGGPTLDVMRQHPRKRDWVALMVSVDPNDLKHCTCATFQHCFMFIRTTIGPETA